VQVGIVNDNRVIHYHYCCCRDTEREYDANEDHDSDSDVPSVRGNHRLTGNEDDSIDYDD